MEESDLIVTGTVTFGDTDVLRSQGFYLNGWYDCFTEVYIKPENIVYNIFGETDAEEIRFLVEGGETDTCIYPMESDLLFEEGDRVCVFLDFDGAVYRYVMALEVNTEGEINLPLTFFPKTYSDEYEKFISPEKYGEVLKKYFDSFKTA